MSPLRAPLIVPAIRLDRDAPAEEALALRRAAQPWVAGFLLFGGEAAQVAALTARLRDAAGRPLFVASDMERGAGQQVQGLTRLPDAGLLGLAGSMDDAFAFGALTAHEALSVGVDVIFAPCVDVRSELDNPILGNRSFGYDPTRVAALGAAFATGVTYAGALPVAKHFPGHGATTEDSHDAIPVVNASEGVLHARDLEPFERLLGAGLCPALMTAHVAYPALDPSGDIATFSAPIVALARAWLPEGESPPYVFTDALLMAGAHLEGAGDGGGEAEAARRALLAGCDGLLYPEDPEAVAAGLAGAGGALAASIDRASASTERLLVLAAEARAHGAGDVSDFLALPQRVADRAAYFALGSAGWAGPDAVLVIDDDGIEDRGAVLVERGRAEGRPVGVVRPGEGLQAASGPLPEPAPEQRWVLVVIASARAWKGTSGVSPACLGEVEGSAERLHEAGAHVDVVWCTPRGVGTAGAHLPGSGPHLEHALAGLLWPREEGA